MRPYHARSLPWTRGRKTPLAFVEHCPPKRVYRVLVTLEKDSGKRAERRGQPEENDIQVSDVAADHL